MQAVVVERPGQLTVTTVPDPEPGHGDVVVEVGACGICGTDLHIADGDFPPTPYPIIPGHEFAGTVAAVGSDVRGVETGQRVAVDPSLPCGRCAPCRAGRGNLCDNWGATGDTVDGAFAQYVAVPERTVYRLPDTVSLTEGALVEPLSCAVHAMDRLGSVTAARTVLAGAGTMGLLLLQLLRHAGVDDLTVVDRNRDRLRMAQRFGATMTAPDLSELGDERYDLAVDATGVPVVIEAALRAVAKGGRFLVFGVAPATATVRLSPFRVYNEEITVLGSMAVLHSYGRALELVASGAVDVEPLVSATLPIERFPDALAAVRAGHGLKTHIRPVE